MSETAPSAGESVPDDGYGPAGHPAWLDVDWQAHQRWLTVAERPVNVIEIGEGPPAVLIHGWGGSWQNWLENIPFLARDRRVVALDLPGFGESPMPRDRITITAYAHCVRDVCAQLGIDAAAVIGNSMGGFVASELAIRVPHIVERLVLVSAAGLAIEHQRREPVRTIARAVGFGMEWLAPRSRPAARRPRLRRALLASVCLHPDRIPAPLAYELLRASGKPGFIDGFDALTSYPIHDRLVEIACPTLIVWGTHDRLVPLADADEFERLIPDSRKVIFEETGHTPMLERPARFNALVSDFVNE